MTGNHAWQPIPALLCIGLPGTATPGSHAVVDCGPLGGRNTGFHHCDPEDAVGLFPRTRLGSVEVIMDDRRPAIGPLPFEQPTQIGGNTGKIGHEAVGHLNNMLGPTDSVSEGVRHDELITAWKSHRANRRNRRAARQKTDQYDKE